MSERRDNSYRDILRSSSVMGGAQGLNYVVGMVRVKIVAVLLGPSGIGLVGLFQSVLGLLANISGLGIGSSGVREVALAHGQDDPALVARTVLVLRRVCWATGLLGWVLAAALAAPLSHWTFGDTDHAVAIAVLGVTLLLGAVSGGQTALIQGVRRIGDLARIQIAAMLANTAVAIAIYAWLHEQGIVPVLVATAAISLGSSWWFARRVQLEPLVLPWKDTWRDARRFAALGLAFMWSGLLTAGLDMAIRVLVTRTHGLEAAGYYQAAWALSGMFAGFILSAMGTDFYPRLSAVINDREAAACMVNEQTEIGILLALPGLLGTLAFAPWALELFYSEKFRPAAELLPWFILGVFGRVVSWPLGYILLAKGTSRWFIATETAFAASWLGLAFWFVQKAGVVGVAYAFAFTYFMGSLGMLWAAHALIGFRWTHAVYRLLALTAVLVGLGFGLALHARDWPTVAGGAALTLIAGLVSFRGLVSRMGNEHGASKLMARIPLIGRVMGGKKSE